MKITFLYIFQIFKHLEINIHFLITIIEINNNQFKQIIIYILQKSININISAAWMRITRFHQDSEPSSRYFSDYLVTNIIHWNKSTM